MTRRIGSLTQDHEQCFTDHRIQGLHLNGTLAFSVYLLNLCVCVLEDCVFVFYSVTNKFLTYQESAVVIRSFFCSLKRADAQKSRTMSPVAQIQTFPSSNFSLPSPVSPSASSLLILP